MAEYIKREALLLRIDCHGTNKFGMLDEDIRAFVKAQPAADVAPVVHGHKVDDGGFYARCSQCDGVLPLCANYCPNCGAKMNGGADNEAG